MKKILYFIPVMALLCACNGNKTQKVEEEKDTLGNAVTDTAVYGKCGDGTAMHSIELITDDGKTMNFVIDEDSLSDLQGGLFSGDRLSITYHQTEEGNIVTKAVNLTTLLGRWTSLDRNFTIHEDGSVESALESESRPWTAWSMCNGNIVFNADTFAINSLGADSLALENDKGIYLYKRASNN